jgi:hypothetical protein
MLPNRTIIEPSCTTRALFRVAAPTIVFPFHLLIFSLFPLLVLNDKQYQAGVPRHVWLAGSALRPYFEDVREIVAQKDEIRELRSHKIVTPDKLSFDHCPIVDCGVTDDSKVLALAQKLVKDISEGEVIYLHCWGGHGRTGTVVCIMLYLLYGVSGLACFPVFAVILSISLCSFFQPVYTHCQNPPFKPDDRTMSLSCML